VAESAALLRYVTGARVRSPGAIIRLARAMRRDRAFLRALPSAAVRWPALIRFVEPLRPAMQHRLSRRLHLAAMVAESLPAEPKRRAPWWVAIGGQIALEAMATPFRLVFGRLTA
jgi:hypothetical protein